MDYRMLLLTVLALVVSAAEPVSAQGSPSKPANDQTQSAPAPTLSVTSNLVFLDVTVLDKEGHPVTSGLTRKDFSVTENGKPQHIFSFEAPELHTTIAKGPESESSEEKSPVTILVVDLLNSRFQDFAYIRDSVRKYLLAQPEQLSSPAEMLVVGDEAVDMLQGYTRSRDDLVHALDHLPDSLPYKHINGAFWAERFDQSLAALQQIALQNKGVPGRKNVIWVGNGGPNLKVDDQISPTFIEKIREYVHMTTNMLVDSRISLFVIYPGLSVNSTVFRYSAMDSDVTLGDDDPFAGDNINFGLLSNETGGKVYFHRNDIDQEIARSVQLGSNYYTLTYQPPYVDPNGKFRHVRVTLRNRSLRVVTKAGYFAPDAKALINPDQQHVIKIGQALQTAFPINSLDVEAGTVLRHPDAQTAQVTVLIGSKNLDFKPDASGHNSDHLLIAAASLDSSRRLLAWRVQGTGLTTAISNPKKLPGVVATIPITLRYPEKTKFVRIVVEDENGGRIGSAEVEKSYIDRAPDAPTPAPLAVPRRPTL